MKQRSTMLTQRPTESESDFTRNLPIPTRPHIFSGMFVDYMELSFCQNGLLSLNETHSECVAPPTAQQRTDPCATSPGKSY